MAEEAWHAARLIRTSGISGAEEQDGGFSHVAWWEGDDNHNVDAWESEAAFEAFGRDRLGPAMAKLGIDVAPEVTFYPAHEVYTPQLVKLTS